MGREVSKSFNDTDRMIKKQEEKKIDLQRLSILKNSNKTISTAGLVFF